MRVAIALCAVLAAGCPKGADATNDQAATANAGPAGPGAAGAGPAGPAAVDAVLVVSKPLDTTTHLEGELTPYEGVALFARVSGFVQRVLVDRGSKVKEGALLARIEAPELAAQRLEAEAKWQSDRSTYERLRAASQTVGAVSGQELEVAGATATADEQRVRSLRSMEQYLNVTAPFDGMITERNVHPGALVGPQSSDKGTPMLRIEQVATLRLTVAVPEGLVGDIAEGTPAPFTVRAWPARTFQGITKRIAHSIDTKTRTMPIELDVDNSAGELAPGMFADVTWRVRRTALSSFVPAGAVVVTTEKTFIVRVKDGRAEQVSVRRGVPSGDLVEVLGDIHEGDLVAKRGSEELRTGSKVAVKVAGGEAKP